METPASIITTAIVELRQAQTSTNTDEHIRVAIGLLNLALGRMATEPRHEDDKYTGDDVAPGQ
jgi:hypothetical protein